MKPKYRINDLEYEVSPVRNGGALTLEIDDGVGDPQIVTIESEIGKSGAIKIIYDPNKK